MASTILLAPEYSNAGPPKALMNETSVVRVERIGPTTAVCEWKTAAKRVTPPSTCSSKTMSAAFRPCWGRAAGLLSILAITAGRSGSVPGNPVSGAVPGAATGGGAAALATTSSSPRLPRNPV